MSISDAAVGRQHQQQDLRAAHQQRAGRWEEVREGEADDVKRFELFRRPLHDM